MDVCASATTLPTTMDTPADLPGYHVYRPVDLDATGSPLSVITWANGGCVRFDGVWAPLLERWAAAGFVVIAIAGRRPVAVERLGAQGPFGGPQGAPPRVRRALGDSGRRSVRPGRGSAPQALIGFSCAPGAAARS